MELIKRTYNVLTPEEWTKISEIVGEDYSDLVEILKGEHENEWVSITDSIGDDSVTIPEPGTFIKLFKSIYLRTAEKYQTMIAYYNKCRADLLNKMSNLTDSRFNDTPESAGDYSASEHTTNITKGKALSDPQTLIDRLDAIQSAYVVELDKWANEFSKLWGTPVYE